MSADKNATPDRIERELTIAAPIERVWAVLTEPGHVSEWFSPGGPAEIDLRPGGIMVLDHGEYGLFRTRIVKADRPHHFSYLWASGYPGQEADESNATLVEFTLTERDGGTHLAFCESGFATVPIPPERRANASYESHSGGWPETLEGMARLAEQSAG